MSIRRCVLSLSFPPCGVRSALLAHPFFADALSISPFLSVVVRMLSFYDFH